MNIASYKGTYRADFYSDFSFTAEVAQQSHKFFIIDKKVFGIYRETLSKLVGSDLYYLLDAVEENKNVDKALEIMDQMVNMPSKRNTVLVAIGGGIVQDVAAFIANVLYRGISWILVPTTLLAQTDSCIGSKSSLNFRGYKNLLGYFYPPDRIYINTEFLHTLERKDYFSGLGEIMKCALMAGYGSFRETAGNMEDVLDHKEDALLKEIHKALEFKRNVIEQDEFDRDYRNIMNFGHTFGHALESVSGYAVPHGQAVSYGMMIANRISCQRGYISREMLQEIDTAIWNIVMPELVCRDFFAEALYLNAMKKDKKYTGGQHTCILFDGDGVGKYTDIRDGEIMDAAGRVMEEAGKRLGK